MSTALRSMLKGSQPGQALSEDRGGGPHAHADPHKPAKASPRGGGGGGGGGKEAADEDAGDSTEPFDKILERCNAARMPPHFRPLAYQSLLVVVAGLCLCVWLVPLRLYPRLVNIACLVRAARNVGGNVVLSVFLARELVLDDGFSRINASVIAAKLLQARHDVTVGLDALRLGGYIMAEGDNVKIGADEMGLADYESIMYQAGCPWRVNNTNCTIMTWTEAQSEGLYRFLRQLGLGVDLVLDKYPPGPGSLAGGSFSRITPRAERRRAMEQDQDLSFVLESQGVDALDGLNTIINVFHQEQDNLLNQMHDEIQLLISLFIISMVGIFYMGLFRTALRAAKAEVVRTRAFVAMIPAHALTRQDAESIMQFFVPDGNAEADVAPAPMPPPAAAYLTGSGRRKSVYAMGLSPALAAGPGGAGLGSTLGAGRYLGEEPPLAAMAMPRPYEV